tara:strand:- start:1043 stop:1216 length:174 start_codon:yes stop_codon:yes gene_type:complete
MKPKFETVEEFLKRGGKVQQLPEEIEWNIIPLEETVRLKSGVETLDYERDHRPKWKN